MKWLNGSKVWYNGMVDPTCFSMGDVSLLKKGRAYTVRKVEEHSDYTLLFLDEMNNWFNSSLFEPENAERKFGGMVASIPQLGTVIKCIVDKFNGIMLDNPVPKKTTYVVSVGLDEIGFYHIIDTIGDQYVVSVA